MTSHVELGVDLCGPLPRPTGGRRSRGTWGRRVGRVDSLRQIDEGIGMGAGAHLDAAVGLALIGGKGMEAVEERGSHVLLPFPVSGGCGDPTRAPLSLTSRRTAGAGAATLG